MGNRISDKLYKLSRTAKMAEVISTGNPSRIARYLVNRFIGRKIFKLTNKLYRR
jgi:hypothetical protein